MSQHNSVHKINPYNNEENSTSRIMQSNLPFLPNLKGSNTVKGSLIQRSSS